MSNSTELKEEAEKRGGWKFTQLDIFADQEQMIKKHIALNGGTKASVIRLALDKLLNPDNEH